MSLTMGISVDSTDQMIGEKIKGSIIIVLMGPMSADSVETAQTIGKTAGGAPVSITIALVIVGLDREVETLIIIVETINVAGILAIGSTTDLETANFKEAMTGRGIGTMVQIIDSPVAMNLEVLVMREIFDLVREIWKIFRGLSISNPAIGISMPWILLVPAQETEDLEMMVLISEGAILTETVVGAEIVAAVMTDVVEEYQRAKNGEGPGTGRSKAETIRSHQRSLTTKKDSSILQKTLHLAAVAHSILRKNWQSIKIRSWNYKISNRVVSSQRMEPDQGLEMRGRLCSNKWPCCKPKYKCKIKACSMDFLRIINRIRAVHPIRCKVSHRDLIKIIGFRRVNSKIIL